MQGQIHIIMYMHYVRYIDYALWFFTHRLPIWQVLSSMKNLTTELERKVMFTNHFRS